MPLVTRAFQLLAHTSTSEEVSNLRIEALNVASKLDAGETIQMLLEGADFEIENLQLAFRFACGCGSKRAVHLLLTYDDSHSLESKQLNRGLIIASGNRYSDVARAIILGAKDQELSLSALNDALHIASLNGHSEVVGVLLREGADPNTTTEEPQNEEPKGSNHNLYGGASGPRKRTSLQAALDGFRASFSYFPPGLRAMRSRWRTANETSKEATVLLLLDGGADVSYSRESSQTLMGIAVRCCSETIVQATIYQGASILDHHTELSQRKVRITSHSEITRAKGSQ